MTIGRRLLVPGLAATAGVIAYERFGRSRQERWGATDDEVAAPLVGDEHVTEPAMQVTRAITIDAPPAAVWPWVAQLGADRGGFYSYDRLENLFGLGIHSADHVVEEWQDVHVGDIVYASRSRTGGWLVVECRPGEALVLQVADVASRRPLGRDEKLGWEFLWTFALVGTEDGRTRLLVRERVAFTNPVTRILMAPVGLVSFVMTRRMLLGIRSRAEAAHSSV
jgi:hypothetical protein